MNARRSICLGAACALLLGSAAEANTRFGFGTIVAVDADGSQNKRMKGPNYTVLFEFRNLAWSRLWHRESYAFEGRTRHGPRVYFLDGEPSTATEAIKLGRAICHTANDMVTYVSSMPGPQPLGAEGASQEGLCRIDLPKGVRLIAGKVSKLGADEPKPMSVDGVLLLDLSRDGIAGAAVIDLFRDHCDHVLDCSKLQREGGRVTGPLTVQFTLPPVGPQEEVKQGYRLKDGNTVELSWTIDAATGRDRKVSGSFTGTSNGAKVKGTLRGEMLPRNELPASPRVWLQLTDLPVWGEHGRGYLVLALAKNPPDRGAMLFSKGDRRGSVTASDVRLADGRVRGTATVSLKGDDKPLTLTLDAKVLGNRMLCGPVSVTYGDDKRSCTARGGFIVAEGLQVEGPSGQQMHQVKQMQAGRGK